MFGRTMKPILMIALSMLATTSLAGAAAPFPVTFVTQWGTLGSEPGQLRWPEQLVIDGDGNVWVVDHGNDRIQKFSNTGVPLLQFGGTGSGDGMMVRPIGLAIGPDGSVYTSESTPNVRIQKFSSTGTFVTKWGSYGSCDGYFYRLSFITTDGSGHVYASDPENFRIQKFTSDGAFVTKWGSWETGCNPGDWGGNFYPGALALAPSGNILVGDNRARVIAEYTTSGNLVRQLSFNSLDTGGIAQDPNTGNIYATEGYADKVHVFNNAGELIGEFGETGTGEGQFNFPVGVAVDEEGHIYVGDLQNHRIQKFSAGAVTPIGASTWGRLKATYR